MRGGCAGDVAISGEETSALVADLSISTVVVVVLVATALLAYFRWWPSLVVLLGPLTLATVFAFSIVSLPPLSITELNSNTAFLGSIIVGNGINFAIVLLARHLEERRAGRSVEDALAAAVRGTVRPTLLAALAAGASYVSLALTDFRGFRQFGYIGGVGMVFSWAAAFVLMPPLVARMDAGGARAPSMRRPRFSPAAALGRLVEEHPRAIVAVSLALTLASLAEVRTFDGRQIETDFSKLRRADTWQTGEGYWGRRMEALLGTYLTPTILLTDSVEQARAIEASLRSPAWAASLSGRRSARSTTSCPTIRRTSSPRPPSSATTSPRAFSRASPKRRASSSSASRAPKECAR
jgi:predicted exporter